MNGQLLGTSTAIFTGITAVATICGVVVTWQAERRRHRPNVFFEMAIIGDHLVLALVNSGAGIARQIQVRVDPELKINRKYPGSEHQREVESAITKTTLPALLPSNRVEDGYTFLADEIKAGFTNHYKFRTTVWFYDDAGKVRMQNTVDYDLFDQVLRLNSKSSKNEDSP